MIMYATTCMHVNYTIYIAVKQGCSLASLNLSGWLAVIKVSMVYNQSVNLGSETVMKHVPIMKQ